MRARGPAAITAAVGLASWSASSISSPRRRVGRVLFGAPRYRRLTVLARILATTRMPLTLAGAGLASGVAYVQYKVSRTSLSLSSPPTCPCSQNTNDDVSSKASNHEDSSSFGIHAKNEDLYLSVLPLILPSFLLSLVLRCASLITSKNSKVDSPADTEALALAFSDACDDIAATSSDSDSGTATWISDQSEKASTIFSDLLASAGKNIIQPVSTAIADVMSKSDNDNDHSNSTSSDTANSPATPLSSSERDENKENKGAKQLATPVDAELTRRMIEVRALLSSVNANDDDLSLPSIVVIGSQSAGKSSVLESIVGTSFLPKGTNMVTRRPLELVLVNDPSRQTPVAEFPQLGMNKITDFKIVERTLRDLNEAVGSGISPEPIVLRISASSVPHLTLVDLPGYIQVTTRNQPESLKESIAELCDRYIQPTSKGSAKSTCSDATVAASHNVILAVCAADVDLANAEALRAARRADPKGTRTIGVLTKMDLVQDRTSLIKKSVSDYPLSLGYIGVNTSSNKTATTAAAAVSSDPNDPHGLNKLRKVLSGTLEKHMVSRLQTVSAAVERELAETSYLAKVRHNDARASPDSYIAEIVDALKFRIKDVGVEFLNRDSLRAKILEALEKKVSEINRVVIWDPVAEQRAVAESAQAAANAAAASVAGTFGSSGWSWGTLIWPWGWSSNSDTTVPQATEQKSVPVLKPSSNIYLLQSDLEKQDLATDMLTQSGIGKNVTEVIVTEIEKEICGKVIESNDRLSSHPKAREQLSMLVKETIAPLRDVCINQVENAIKPYKVDPEITHEEWTLARKHGLNLISQLESEYRRSMSKAQETSPVLQQIPAVLKARKAHLASRKCSSHDGSQGACPEIYLECLAGKIAKTAAMFVYIELVSEIFRRLPRDIETKFAHAMTPAQKLSFARENPRVLDQIEVSQRRAVLEAARAKLAQLT